MYLPTWTATSSGFHIPFCEKLVVPQGNREPISQIVMTHKLFAFNTHQNMPLIIERFYCLLDHQLTPDELHSELDKLEYRTTVPKGRITSLIKELRCEGIELSRRKIRDGKKTFNVYQVSQIKVEPVQEETKVLRKKTVWA